MTTARAETTMYYAIKILPQVADTNLFGHVDHLAFLRWCDRARAPLYEEMLPGFRFLPRGLVVANVKIDYLRETFLDDRVEVRTWTSRIGRKSFELTQEVWRSRDDAPTPSRCAVAKSVFCAFDFNLHKSEPLSERFQQVLRKYQWSSPESTSSVPSPIGADPRDA